MVKLLIGVAGGSGSGKTTLARAIAEEIGEDKALLISLDWYYKDLSRLKPEERAKVDFDNPDAIDWPLLREHAKLLLKNKKINAPKYSFATHSREGYRTLEPKDVIIFEGIFALHDPELCKLMKVRLFVETPADLRLVRRIQRDVIERKRSVESILEQWHRQVSPAHDKFIEPSAKKAHLILPEDPEGNMREVATDVIKSMVKEFYTEKKVKIYYGEEGVKKVFQDIIAEGKPNCVLDSEGQFTERMPEFAKWFVRQVEKKKIQIRHIVRTGKDIKPSKTTKVKYVKKSIKSNAAINIYSDRIAIIVWSRIPEVVIVHDSTVADSLRDYFNILWKT